MNKLNIAYQMHLQVQLSSSPVSSLAVVSDGGVSLKSEPVRKRSVLLSSLGKLDLGSEGFVRLLLS